MLQIKPNLSILRLLTSLNQVPQGYVYMPYLLFQMLQTSLQLFLYHLK